MKQNLSEVILPDYIYYEHYRGNENSIPFLGNINQTFLDMFDTSIPINKIQSIKPYRSSYRYADETLVVNFKYPYNVYNDWSGFGYVRVNHKELMNIINRKRKNTKVYLKIARRYIYIHLKEE